MTTTTARLGLAGGIAGVVVVIALGMMTAARGTADPSSAAATATPPASHVHPHVAGEDEPQEPSAARRLVRATRRQADRWSTVAAAQDDGYRSIGDAITGHEHYVHWKWAGDNAVLRPRRPESLVYRVDGPDRTLVSVLYILPTGATMADVPDLGDDRAQWHRHTNLCWEGRRVAGLFSDGRCIPGGQRRVTAPMLHVWLTPQPCGPFAGLGLHGGHCRSG